MLKKCNHCHVPLDISNFSLSKTNIGGYKHQCKSCCNSITRNRYNLNRHREIERNRNKYSDLRKEVFSNYGLQCACCGENEYDFLTIDHDTVNKQEHKKVVRHGAVGVYLYYWLKRNNYPTGFQTLCMNCNFSKYKNDGECMHQLKRELADV